LSAALGALAQSLLRWHNTERCKKPIRTAQKMTDAQSAAGPLIHGIPLALWVTIIVAVLSPIITLISVGRSNGASRKNLKDQLAHDADQRDRERKMSLRREVYLQAAEALAHANTLIGRLSNPNSDEHAIAEEWAKDLVTISKTHIVGNDETVAAVMTYVNVLGPAFLEMLGRRVPLVLRKQMIETHDGLARKADLDRERLLALMQEYNLQLVKDQEKRDALNVQFEIASNTSASQHHMALELRLSQVREQLAVTERVQALARLNTKLLPEAVLAVRKEMDLPLDRIAYERLWAAQQEKMEQAWGPLIAQTQAMIAQLERDAAKLKQPPAPPPP
jgi:hypothetical protein